MKTFHSFEEFGNTKLHKRKRFRRYQSIKEPDNSIDARLSRIKKEMEKEFGKREFYYFLFGEKIIINQNKVIEYQAHGAIIYDSWKL